MKVNLSNIIETWAMLYAPISHDPAKDNKGKAFYKVRTINDQSEFVRNQNTAKSPCVAYSVLIDAEGTNDKVVNYAHTIYFLARGRSRSLAKNARQDDDIGDDVYKMLDDIVNDFIVYMRELKHTMRCPITGQQYDADTRQMLAGLQLDKVEWASIPVKFGEWYILELSLEQNAARPRCINREKYKSE